MPAWRRVALVSPAGTLRAPAEVTAEVGSAETGVLLTGHTFGRVPTYARLLCRHLGALHRPWAIGAEPWVGREHELLRLARRSGCHALVFGPDPEPLALDASAPPGALRAVAADLRRIRRARLLTVLHCVLGRPGDDAGVFARVVQLSRAGRVAFPQLVPDAAAGGISHTELTDGLAWARRALHTHAAIWHRCGLATAGRRGALVANYRHRREVLAAPPRRPTPAMRLARALARPIRIRERVPFVSTLVGAVQARGDQVRNAWLRVRTVRDETVKGLVIRLEGALDARAARTLVARVRRALGGRPERIIVDLGGLEVVSLTVFTRFLAEHERALADLRGRLAFRNLRPALAAVRDNLHGMLPNAALLEPLDEAP